MLSVDEWQRRDYLLEMELLLLRNEHEQAEREVAGKTQRVLFLKQALESGRGALAPRHEMYEGTFPAQYSCNLTRLELALEQAEKALRRAQERASRLARQARVLELGRGLLGLERMSSNF
jgi:hypothetical protein